MNGPIYSTIYREMWDEEPPQGVQPIPVHFHDPSGESAGYAAYLVPCSFLEAATPLIRSDGKPARDLDGRPVYPAIYVPLVQSEDEGDEMAWPYAAYDCTEVVDLARPRMRERAPRRFVEATLVATTKVAII